MYRQGRSLWTVASQDGVCVIVLSLLPFPLSAQEVALPQATLSSRWAAVMELRLMPFWVKSPRPRPCLPGLPGVGEEERIFSSERGDCTHSALVWHFMCWE